MNGSRRFAIVALLHTLALAGAAIFAAVPNVPGDLAHFPLAVVIASQSSLFASWLVVARMRTVIKAVLVAIFAVGYAILYWLAHGAHMPADTAWLLLYIAEPLGPILCIALAAHLARRFGIRFAPPSPIQRSPNYQFSIADVLVLTAGLGMTLGLSRMFGPNWSEYQYTGSVWQSVLSVLWNSLSSTAIVGAAAWLCLKTEFKLQWLVGFIAATFAIGILVAQLAGARANPLWTSVTCTPAAVAVVITATLLGLRTIDWGCERRLNHGQEHNDRKFSNLRKLPIRL